MKIRNLAIIMVLALSFGAYAQQRSDTIRARLLDPTYPEVLVAAHRGDWRNYAENTLEGIKSAINLGADIVEIDLRRTKDGELILMHDSKLDRTTNGKGRVEDMTLSEIKKLNVKNGVAGVTPYKVPTFREVMSACKGRALFDLDKAFEYFDQVMEILEETGTASQAIMKSREPADTVIARYGRHLDKIIYKPLVKLDKPESVDVVRDMLTKLNPKVMELGYVDTINLQAPVVSDMLRGKVRIWYNSLWSTLAGGHDDFASLRHPSKGWGFLVDSLGAGVIQTDQTHRVINYLAEHKHRPDYVFDSNDEKWMKARNKQRSRETDWAKFYRYESRNAELTRNPEVVFMGNSITDTWARTRPEFFEKHNFAGRGISGQTSSHMLVRFQEDVIGLHPRAVVILAGINDLAHNNGKITVKRIFNNIKSMCQLAKANGINPVIASVLPSYQIPFNKAIFPAKDIVKLNSLLKDYARANNFTYMDYYSHMVDNRGGLPDRLTHDGVHPTPAGYEVMEQVVEETLTDYINKQ